MRISDWSSDVCSSDLAATRLYSGAGIDSYCTFDASANHCFLCTQARYRLTLHVGAPQCTVGIIMLAERNERGRNRHDLAWRHVHILHALRLCQRNFIMMACGEQFFLHLPFGIQFRVRLGTLLLAFLIYGKDAHPNL